MKYTVEQLENADYDSIIGLSIDDYYYNVDYVCQDEHLIVLYEIEYNNRKWDRMLVTTEMDFDDLIKHDLKFFEYKEIDLTK